MRGSLQRRERDKSDGGWTERRAAVRLALPSGFARAMAAAAAAAVSAAAARIATSAVLVTTAVAALLMAAAAVLVTAAAMPLAAPTAAATQPAASAPASVSTPEPLRLSIREAVRQALVSGTAAQLAGERIEESRAAAGQARSALLPQVNATASQVTTMTNLAALGFSAPGLPSLVGPYGVFDVHAAALMNVLDLASRRRLETARQGVRVSEAERRRVRNDVASMVATLYVALQRAEATVGQAQASVGLAENLRKLARDQWRAGVGTRLDSLRAETQLSRERQSLLTAGNQREAARLALLHAMGADMASPVTLADTLGGPGPPAPGESEALATARALRPELASAEESRRAAQLGVEAAGAQRMPTLGLQAEAGFNGQNAGSLQGVRTLGAAVTLPLFEGGRISADQQAARARERQVDLQRTETGRQVEEEVRRALLSYQNTSARVQLATETMRVAAEELDVATHRFRTGAGSSIEVDNAQSTLSGAREARVGGLADQAQAWFDLMRATGQIRDLAGDQTRESGSGPGTSR